MPNPYDLNFSKFSYKPPTPARGTGFQSPMGAEEVPPPPLPPRPPMPFMPIPFQTPTPEMPEATLSDGSGSMIQSGFEAGSKVPGSMTSTMPRMDPSQAVAGLRGMNYPELDRIKNAFDISSSVAGGAAGSGAGSLGLSNAILSDVNQSFSPQREQIGMAQKAMAAQHPAVAGLAERGALQKAYPQQVEAQGRIRSQEVANQGELEKAGIGAEGDISKNISGQVDYILRGLSETDKLLVAPDLTDDELARVSEARQRWIGMLQKLGQAARGPIPNQPLAQFP